MQQLRLFGLVLFITTIFLAMAAAATQTTHIRFKQPSHDAGPADDNSLQFTAIPVVYPLVIAGGIGLLMWFVPAPLTAHKPARKKRRSSSRRRRK